MIIQDDQRLKESLEYFPETGEFRWKINRRSRNGKAKIGALAGNVYGGYRTIVVFQKKYKASWLAWLFVYGQWPTRMIDHINGVPSDDRIANLREATNAQNQWNKRTYSKTGFKGVYKLEKYGLWVVTIQSHGRKQYIGRYKTIEEAVAARAEAAERLHGEFARAA